MKVTVQQERDCKHYEVKLRGASLYFVEYLDKIHLSVIEVKDKRRGRGTKLMRDLEYFEKPIELCPVPESASNFYLKLGYRWISETKMRKEI